MTFEDKVVVVTGGASGIGEATAKLLAERGARVVIGDVSAEAGGRVVQDIEAAGGSATFVLADVSKEETGRALVAHSLQTYGRLDLAANIAGIGQRPSRIHEMDEATWDLIFDIDLKGMWFCMKAQLAHFLSSGGGNIVNMASGAGLRATVGQPAYATAKAGVIALSRQAAVEYAKDNIRVNSVAPGLIDTPAVQALPDHIRSSYAAGQPTGKLGLPIDVAHTVAWLLSDEAAYVTGTVHITDGGLTQQ